MGIGVTFFAVDDVEVNLAISGVSLSAKNSVCIDPTGFGTNICVGIHDVTITDSSTGTVDVYGTLPFIGTVASVDIYNLSVTNSPMARAKYIIISVVSLIAGIGLLYYCCCYRKRNSGKVFNNFDIIIKSDIEF